MVHALKVSAVVPSKKFFSFYKHGHGLNPERILKRFQAPGQGVLNIWKIVAALEGIAAPARCARDLPELSSSLTGPGRQVIAAFRHFTGSAQSAGYFFGFFFIHNLIISYSLQPVNLVARALTLYGRAHPLEACRLNLLPTKFQLEYSAASGLIFLVFSLAGRAWRRAQRVVV